MNRIYLDWNNEVVVPLPYEEWIRLLDRLRMILLYISTRISEFHRLEIWRIFIVERTKKNFTPIRNLIVWCCLSSWSLICLCSDVIKHEKCRWYYYHPRKTYRYSFNRGELCKIVPPNKYFHSFFYLFKVYFFFYWPTTFLLLLNVIHPFSSVTFDSVYVFPFQIKSRCQKQIHAFWFYFLRAKNRELKSPLTFFTSRIEISSPAARRCPFTALLSTSGLNISCYRSKIHI